MDLQKDKQTGVAMAEYGIIIGCMAVFTIVGIRLFSGNISFFLTWLAGQFNTLTPPG